MKRIIRSIILSSIVIAVLGLGALPASRAAEKKSEELTAFQLVKEGNEHLGKEARDRVVQIRSEKSVGSLIPNVWYIVYYDPDATAKAVEVKFGAGRKLHVKRPARIFELAGKSHLPMDQTKLKVDSDKAIETALKEPMLKNLKIRATRLTLERWEEKPVWKVQLWAAKLRKPTKNANIGEIYIACADGKVVRNKLKIQRVD